jgi:peptidoglycan/LPS O-acetylase OafA/YrhL
MDVTAIKQPRLRLGYLDGLRGLAALYVVIFHVSQLCHGYAGVAPDKFYAVGDWKPGASAAVRSLVRASHFVVLGYGRFAVDVFIVLSGYVLMLPVVRAGRDTVGGGFWTFITRRAKRILPPYYAAIGLIFLMALLVPAMSRPDPVGAYWDACTPTFHLWSFVSHLFLVHTWTPWGLRIEGPMWSVAVEWQIYLLFPLLMLPVRRWIGTIPMAVLFFAGGQLGYWALQSHLHAIHSSMFDQMGNACPWFAGEFAMGAVAASLAFASNPREKKLYERLPWRALAVFFSAALVFLTLVDRHSWKDVRWLQLFREANWGDAWVTDLTVSLAVMCAIVYLTRQVIAGTPGRLLRVLDRKWAVRLGEFSYSLYLVHYPVINLFDLYFRYHYGPATVCILAYTVSLPVAVGLSYLFHLAFERPFMSAIQKQLVPAVESSTMPELSNSALDPSLPGAPAGADSQPANPTVSVVIPNHNSASYLPRAIRSVLGQTYPNVEVIVVDDLSSEDPSPALAEFGDRVRLIRHETNGGPSAARNTGAAAASGQVLAFLDADDWWPLDFLARVVPLVHGGVCACYDSYSIDEAALATGDFDGRTSGQTLCHEWLLSGPPSIDRGNMQSLLTRPSLFKMVVHRSDHEAVGGFDPRYREGEDLHFCLKLVAAGRRLVVVEQPKGFYLVRSGSILRTAESDPGRRTESLHAWWGMFRDLPLEQSLPSPVESECGRLSDYYRARYADATLKQHLRGGRILTLLKPATLKAAVPAVPGMMRLKADGLARRVRSLSRRVRTRRSPSEAAGSDA